ncbi:hypothetical protein J2X46_003667 [Nocardioides sp. BE266]|uniref:hypothetical protein n=1 Tax=Nocardioides sp. BE266 TaxID=2817725 RepID=UPI00286620C3|nr:hypothetical protein [Nocardioides sp. BE266]MDR7254669.1 hypothetical protein [Nocardioides sp. BE266]
MTDLRTSLHRVADDVTPLPVADDLWQRGQSARRRGNALVVAAVLAIIASVTWSAVLLGDGDREARTASTPVVPDGAIPSRIEDPGALTASDDLAVGQASVAFVAESSDVVVVDAADGRYHALALPEAPLTGPVRLSPDGIQLAYAYDALGPEGGPEVEVGVAILDLRSGEVRRVPAISGSGRPVAVSGIGWSSDSAYVAWSGHGIRVWTDSTRELERGGGMLGVIDLSTGLQSTLDSSEGAVSVDGDAAATLVTSTRVTSFTSLSSGATRVPLHEQLPAVGSGDRASTSPSGELTAVDDGSSVSLPFVDGEGDVLRRSLDTELYPDGARVSPLGWAADALLLAQVDAPAGSYVEGRHLALMSSPDRPESTWTYRIVMRDIADVAELSVAVDLIPDLDGTSSQQLTHDFGDVLAPDQRDISWLIGLGVAAAIAVLMGLRWLWRRLLG